jgi:predicted aspartyl protease
VGTFYADFTLWNPGRTQSRSLSGLVDTGASYTLVPALVLDDLDIRRVETLTFRLADGSTRDLGIGWSDMELGGLEARPVYVVFGTQ